MKRGFYTIMAAQFFSSLADNALFIAGVELIKSHGGAHWQQAALVPMFAFFYVALAPFVGAFSDAVPKGRVMFAANSIKILGCAMMLFGGHPLLSYAVVGLGAAAYSPAKYGILTELLPPSQLVAANGWIEGLTVASIILGVLLGGQLLSPGVSGHLLALDAPGIDTGISTAPEAAIASIITFYVVAALFNLRIPRTDAPLRPFAHTLPGLVRDFAACNTRLWRDKLGQISLAATTLIWGVTSNLRYLVLAWAAAALGYGITQASNLVGVVAVGTALGAVLASLRVRLHQATRVIPLGITMGVLMIAMIAIRDVWIAAPFLVLLGAIAGYMVVPMNALLQHRGHNLMGAGRSIAVQNFNEQAAVLLLGFGYTGLTGLGLSAYGAIILFGLLVAVLMYAIRHWHLSNLVHHRDEVHRLLAVARGNSAPH